MQRRLQYETRIEGGRFMIGDVLEYNPETNRYELTADQEGDKRYIASALKATARKGDPLPDGFGFYGKGACDAVD